VGLALPEGPLDAELLLGCGGCRLQVDDVVLQTAISKRFAVALGIISAIQCIRLGILCFIVFKRRATEFPFVAFTVGVD